VYVQKQPLELAAGAYAENITLKNGVALFGAGASAATIYEPGIAASFTNISSRFSVIYYFRISRSRPSLRTHLEWRIENVEVRRMDSWTVDVCLYNIL
jgi:hypothetical protein